MFNFKANNKWKKTSYSQSGEDLIVKFILDGLQIKIPSYIDIGAHHPYNLSNTALFYENGSRGVNIEPDPILYKAFLEVRKQDVNLNCGISDKAGELTLKVLNASTLNTFSDEEAERFVKENNFKIVKRIPVKVLTINDVIKEHCNGIFPDFLSLDAEGFDEIIIKSIDFDGTKPSVICMETISYSENGTGEKNYKVVDYLVSKGYMVYADTNINTILVLKNKWVRK